MRFETTYTALAPQQSGGAMAWNLRSREALLDYLKERNIPTTASLEKSTAVMRTRHISTEGGVLESRGTRQTKIAGCGPSIRWKRRISRKRHRQRGERPCVAVNGEKLSPFQCLENSMRWERNTAAGLISWKTVWWASNHAAATKRAAPSWSTRCVRLSSWYLDRDSFKWREQLGQEMSYVVYDGRWFAPLRQSIGRCRIAGRAGER